MQTKFIKNIIPVLLSNVIILVLGISMAFVLPNVIGSVEGYGYWQLYYYYSGFHAFLLFGLDNGINLLYSGSKFDKIDRKKFSAFLAYIILTTILITALVSSFIFMFIHDANLRITLFFASLNIAIWGINTFSLQVNQITLRFKTYAKLNSLERILFVSAFAPLWLLGARVFWIYMFINILIRFVIMIYSIYTVRAAVDARMLNLKNIKLHKKSIIECIKVGLPLSASMVFLGLITTSPRLVVGKTLTIHDYGLFSLAFSSLSIVVAMIMVLSTVLYPSIKTLDSKYHEKLNAVIKYTVTYLCAIALSVCFFIPYIVKIFLPKYVGIDSYLFVLFPWVIYQCLGGIVNDVFYRVARLERRLLVNNIVGFIIIFAIQYIVMRLTTNLNLTIIIGLVIIACWVHINDAYLRIKNGWALSLYGYVDIPFVAGFIVISSYFKGITGFIVYIMFILVMTLLLIKKNSSLLSSLRLIRSGDGDQITQLPQDINNV